LQINFTKTERGICFACTLSPVARRTLIDLLFHVTQLIDRSNAKSHHAKIKPVASEHQN